jgi:hypothetical protein
MTVTNVGTLSVGATLSATTSATAAVDALVSASLPEVTAKLAAYTLVSVPSPSFDIATQLATAGTNLTADLATVAAIPGVGAAMAAAISAGITAMASLRAANPALGLRVDGSVSAIGGLQAQIASGISGPNINVPLITSILGELGALKASIEAKADLVADINASLGASGLVVYRFDGNLATAGAELQAQITADGITGQAHFVVMLPTNPTAWAALQATVKTS